MTRENILISEQLELITDKIDYILENDLRQLFYSRSHKMKKDSQKIIKEYPRVDTGIMWKGIKSFVTIDSSKLSITLFSRAKRRGSNSPVYSSFNESGTSKMKGIWFIRDSFKSNLKNIDKEIDNLFARV